MGKSTPKQFLSLKGNPVILHTLERFLSLGSFIKKIVVVIPPGSMDYCREFIFKPRPELSEYLVLVEGGKERQDSVYKGLLLLDYDIEIVCIHDGVRPFVSPGLIKKAAEEAVHAGAVIPVLPLKDTVKEVNLRGTVTRTVSRDSLRLVQTPQCFRMEIIRSAFEKAIQEKFFVTDDAALVEKSGFSVSVINGEPENIKITTPGDLIIAEHILERRMSDV